MGALLFCICHFIGRFVQFTTLIMGIGGIWVDSQAVVDAGSY